MRRGFRGIFKFANGGSPPLAPGSFDFDSIGYNSITLSWEEFAANAVNYRLEVSIDSGPYVLVDGNIMPNYPSGGAYFVETLQPDTGYRFRVRAENAFGVSDWVGTSTFGGLITTGVPMPTVGPYAAVSVVSSTACPSYADPGLVISSSFPSGDPFEADIISISDPNSGYLFVSPFDYGAGFVWANKFVFTGGTVNPSIFCEAGNGYPGVNIPFSATGGNGGPGSSGGGGGASGFSSCGGYAGGFGNGYPYGCSAYGGDGAGAGPDGCVEYTGGLGGAGTGPNWVDFYAWPVTGGNGGNGGGNDALGGSGGSGGPGVAGGGGGGSGLIGCGPQPAGGGGGGGGHLCLIANECAGAAKISAQGGDGASVQGAGGGGGTIYLAFMKYDGQLVTDVTAGSSEDDATAATNGQVKIYEIQFSGDPANPIPANYTLVLRNLNDTWNNIPW